MLVTVRRPATQPDAARKRQKEAVMALIHPASRASVPLTKRKFHPAVCLATGFGFIVGAALSVHVVFNLIF